MSEFRTARPGRALARFTCVLGVLTAIAAARAETVTIDTTAAPAVVFAGSTFSFHVVLGDNLTEQFIGYSLDVDVLPSFASTGSITGRTGDPTGLDPGESNFYVSENLIEADPVGSLHPLASVINDGADGGVFVRAFEATLTPIGPAGPGHDVLAELSFDVSPDALGYFTLLLGPGTELLNGPSAPVPYNYSPPTIEVVPVPEPGLLGLLAAAGLIVAPRSRRSDR